jgi:cytochrome c oxidase cbb3-type subunit 4
MNFEELIFDARSVMTVVSFFTFVGILWWTYGAHRSADFEAAANLPFADEMNTQDPEKKHV